MLTGITQIALAVWSLKGKSLALATQYESRRATSSREFMTMNV